MLYLLGTGFAAKVLDELLTCRSLQGWKPDLQQFVRFQGKAGFAHDGRAYPGISDLHHRLAVMRERFQVLDLGLFQRHAMMIPDW